MKQNDKTFRFTTEITPETEILLRGRSGQPLSMSLDDGMAPKTVILDTESVIRLQTFLSDYLQPQEGKPSAPVYEPTGRALAVMDGDTLDIVRVFKTGSIVGFEGAEADSYEDLCLKMRSVVETEPPKNAVFIFSDTFDGTISRSVLRRILRACISYQVDFVRTGDIHRCRPMILEDIEAFTTIDKSVISRATRDVVILSSKGTFTMNSSDTSLDRPSLFDDGVKTVDGKDCSRKAVLSVIRDIFGSEDAANPLTDEAVSDLLAERGYVVARRTVTKYREFLGIPKRSERRIAVEA